MARSPRSRAARAPLGVPLVALLLAAGCGAGGPGSPAERVRDDAGLIDEVQREELSRYHELLLHDHDIDYRVQTVRGEPDLNLYAARRYEELEVGSRSRTGRGLLLVIDAEHDRVRLEVGRALEGQLPDAVVAYLEHRQMVPFFRSGRVAHGILATTELLVSRVQEARARGDWAAPGPIHGTSGAGAATQAGLGAGAEPSREAPDDAGTAARAGATPEATLAAYTRALAERDARPDLDVYSADTRRMLRDWVVTPAQMDHLVRTYRGCHPEPARLDAANARAVIRYPIPERRCSPWFFVREQGRWRLDLTTMQSAIRFGRSNAWRFVPGVEHPYGFAFEGWSLDRNGFPQVARRD